MGWGAENPLAYDLQALLLNKMLLRRPQPIPLI